MEEESGHGRGRHGDGPARRGGVRALSRERRNRAAWQRTGQVATAGTRPAGSVTWAAYRDVTPLDPVSAFGYLENAADRLMCETLLRQTPDRAVVPDLASRPTSIAGIVIEASFAQKQGQNQAAWCFGTGSA